MNQEALPMIKDTLEKLPDCQRLQLDLSQKHPKRKRLPADKRPSQKYIWNKHKLTGTPPKIILQSSTRTTYYKEDMGFL